MLGTGTLHLLCEAYMAILRLEFTVRLEFTGKQAPKHLINCSSFFRVFPLWEVSEGTVGPGAIRPELCGFPRTPLLGSSVNSGTPHALALYELGWYPGYRLFYEERRLIAQPRKTPTATSTGKLTSSPPLSFQGLVGRPCSGAFPR